jgi:putative SOS response-associated peptidase YedK
MFRAALRCLVPAAHYFEWAHRGADRIKYRIGAESGPLYMAGLYRAEDGTPSFVVLTRAADARIAFIHGRMPRILSSGARAAWLRGAPLEKARRGVPQLFFDAGGRANEPVPRLMPVDVQLPAKVPMVTSGGSCRRR